MSDNTMLNDSEAQMATDTTSTTTEGDDKMNSENQISEVVAQADDTTIKVKVKAKRNVTSKKERAQQVDFLKAGRLIADFSWQFSAI